MRRAFLNRLSLARAVQGPAGPSLVSLLQGKVSSKGYQALGMDEVASASHDSRLASPPSLTRRQCIDVLFLVMSFSCVVASLALVVGSGGVVVMSVGGDVALTPLSLGLYFLGMSLVSLMLTHWVFRRLGRLKGFWLGCGLSFFGAMLSCGAMYYSSVVFVLIANLFLGAGSGIGMYLRFAAVEVVPADYHSRAMTWTLAGGCLAAFAGPEAGHATVGKFGHDNMRYIGVFVVTAFFNLAQAIFVSMVKFPLPLGDDNARMVPLGNGTKEKEQCSEEWLQEDETTIMEEQSPSSQHEIDIEVSKELLPLLKQRDFVVPVFVGILSWAIMAMPMSICRVAMTSLGYTPRQSLTVIECHFLGMYSPGFVSGSFIKAKGVEKSIALSVVIFFVATLSIVLVTTGTNERVAPWYVGLVLYGAGWNFAYSAASVWVTSVYAKASHLKQKVQAANECLVFLVSGALIMCTGYIYSAGGEGLSGWKMVNYSLFCLICALVFALGATHIDSMKNTLGNEGVGDNVDS